MTSSQSCRRWLPHGQRWAAPQRCEIPHTQLLPQWAHASWINKKRKRKGRRRKFQRSFLFWFGTCQKSHVVQIRCLVQIRCPVQKASLGLTDPLVSSWFESSILTIWMKRIERTKEIRQLSLLQLFFTEKWQDSFLPFHSMKCSLSFRILFFLL